MAAIATTISVSAAPITPAESISRALADGPLKTNAKTSEYRLVMTRQSDSTDALYVFERNDGSGFMITTADDLVPPVAGYGTSKFLDENGLPAPACDYWLEELARQTVYAATHYSETPRRYVRPARNPIAPLCATQWNQSSPYNDDCPLMNGRRSVTGCAATSTAQIMKYHNWPPVGTGQHSYTWNGTQLSIDYSQTYFDWDNMLNSYSWWGTETTAEKAAVANLMKAVGYALNMNYSPSASGASSTALAPALAQYFRYDKTLRYLSRDEYQLPEWEDLVYNSLIQYGPVIYNGQSTAGGHSFVCDGYSTDGLFHINWGWGGMSDGYFLLDELDPDHQGIGGGSDSGFKYYQDMIIDIRPDFDGTSQYTPMMSFRDDLELKYDKNEKAVVISSLIYNSGVGPIDSGALGLRFSPVDKFDRATGESIELMEEFGEALPVNYGYRDVAFEVSELANERYLVEPIFSGPDGIVTNVSYYPGKAHCYSMRKRNNGATLYPIVAVTPLVSDVVISETFDDVNPINVSAILINPSAAAFTFNCTLSILDDDVTDILASGAIEQIRINGDSSGNMESEVMLSDYTALSVGTYKVALTQFDGVGGHILLTEPFYIQYNGNSGVESLSDDTAVCSRTYYTPEGLKVSTVGAGETPSLPGGIYIVREGNKTYKTIIR